tara:strand:+ start:1940 stop:2053 length:114 start_codon:yes stop_codon:yes gene_type:complete
MELNSLLNELRKLTTEELKKVDLEVYAALMEKEAVDE